jgi:hypothetical protein
MKKVPLSHAQKWRIPHSPPEVQAFDVDKIPPIVEVDDRGRELGRIVENQAYINNRRRTRNHHQTTITNLITTDMTCASGNARRPKSR